MRETAQDAARWLRRNGVLTLAYLLVGLVYTALLYLSFNGIADYTNAHHFFPEPWGGYAMAVVLECSILFAFLVFRRSPIFAGLMLATFAFGSYWLQRLHGELVAHGPGSLHPNLVTAIVPFSLVVMGIALHAIRPKTNDTERTFAVTNREEQTTTTVERVHERERVTDRERRTITGQAAVMELLRKAGGPDTLTTKELVAATSVSDRTVRLARRKLREESDGEPRES